MTAGPGRVLVACVQEELAACAAIVELRPTCDVLAVGPGDALLRAAQELGPSEGLLILLTPKLVESVWPRRAFEVIGRLAGQRACALVSGVDLAWVRRHAPSLAVAETADAALASVHGAATPAPDDVAGPGRDVSHPKTV